MSAVTNEELMKAFQLRQASERTLFLTKNQFMQATTIKRRSELTLADLQDLPEEATVYRSVGRLFLQDSLPEIRSEIKGIIETNTAEMAKLEKAVEVHQKRFQVRILNATFEHLNAL